VTRRRLVLGCTCGTCAILSSLPVYGSDVVHPRNGIRDRVFADAMNHMDMYEEAIRPVKIALFSTLREDLENTLSDTRDDKYSIADIGIGTGPNVKFYDREKAFLQAVEPNSFMRPYLETNLREQGFPLTSVQYQTGFAENLPLESESQDAVVCTLLLCSVHDVSQSLSEFHRVLKQGGSLLVIEHVRAGPNERLLALGQDLLNPLQRALADGCNLNRDTLARITESGLFSTQGVERFSVPNLGVLSPHIAGILKKK
jgi:ubiquinone/menaquinone biosynthesis C-methylase UbiE